MNLCTHGRDNRALTGKITIGEFDGGYLFTTGYLGRGKSRPVHGPFVGSKSCGDAWLMQELASSPMHIICMDLRVAVGKAMLLYATPVHRGHA